MPQVKVQINGRSYPVQCADGEQDHLRQLGTYLDAVVKNLVKNGRADQRQVGDTHLLVLAALTVADELSDAYDKIEQGGGAGSAEPGVVEALDGMAQRLDRIAGRLETLYV
jgi:cell division protein ZapA